MKSCRNCKTIYADEYGGQCYECGAPMGQVEGSNQGDLSFAYARQIQDGQRENSLESAMKRGRYDGVQINERIMDAARGMIVVDEDKLREAERRAEADG